MGDILVHFPYFLPRSLPTSGNTEGESTAVLTRGRTAGGQSRTPSGGSTGSTVPLLVILSRHDLARGPLAAQGSPGAPAPSEAGREPRCPSPQGAPGSALPLRALPAPRCPLRDLPAPRWPLKALGAPRCPLRGSSHPRAVPSRRSHPPPRCPDPQGAPAQPRACAVRAAPSGSRRGYGDGGGAQSRSGPGPGLCRAVGRAGPAFRGHPDGSQSCRGR